MGGSWESRAPAVGHERRRRSEPVQRQASPATATPTVQLVFLVALLAVVAAALAATGIRVLTDGAEDAVLVTQATAGPGGATIRFSDVGRVMIPARALDGERTITVWSHSPELIQKAAGDRPTGTGRVYSFEPSGLRFERLVTIHLPIPAGDRAVEVFVLVDGELRALRGEVDARSGAVVVRTRDFRFGEGSR